jgi:hypothetical protein
MKRILVFSLFIMFVLGLTGCAEKPLCPDWARPDLGDFCETASLSITPPEPIALVSWEIAQLQLQNAVVTRSQGVIFYNEDGVQIEPNELKQGDFYTVRKTEDTGALWISILDPNDKVSPATHLIVAKP